MDVKESTAGTLLVLGATAGFGTIGIFGELAAAVGLDLPTLLVTRFSMATVAMLGLARLRGWSLPQSGREGLATLGLGVAYAGMTLCFFVALRYLTAGLATIVLYTYPVFVFVLSAVFLREAVTARKVFALVLAVGGIALVVGADPAGGDPAGVALALGAALCYAVYTAGSRSAVASVPPQSLMLAVLAGTTACMVVFGLVEGGLSLPAGSDQWAVVLGLTLVGTVVPLLLFYEGVARLEASVVGVVSTAEPVVTVTLGALLLGEPVTVAVLAGGALVLGGVVLAQREAGGPRGTVGNAEVTTGGD